MTKPDERFGRGIDPKIHKRLLRFINEARTPDDLMVLPHERNVAYEDVGHPEHFDHHHRHESLFDRKRATELLRVRDEVVPFGGFRNIGEIADILEEWRDFLDHLLEGFNDAIYGRWDGPFPLETAGGVPFEIEHAALMHTSEVLFLADSLDTVVWDANTDMAPVLTRLTPADTGLTANLVCCGHSFLSDGQLLAAGGGGLGPGNPTSIQAWKFHPTNRRWTKTAGDMSSRRWYPTLVTLGDEAGPTGLSGRVLVAAGEQFGALALEVYSEATDSFATITIAGTEKKFPQTYPGLHLLPGGNVFYVPVGFGNCGTSSVFSLSHQAAYFTFTPNGSNSGNWTDVGPTMNRTKGMSALLLQPTSPFVRVIVVGGGDASTNQTVQAIGVASPTPAWEPPRAFPDARSRVNVSTVLLPDGTVFICGGLTSPPYTCWRYDPSTSVGPWEEMDENHRPRHYHSAALLLPSGRVMVAGGAASGGCTVSVENTIEVFSPPYLFKPDGTPADRPEIVSIDGVAPTTAVQPTVHHGATFVIETAEPTEIAKVVLVRPMAVTHQTDTEQRVIHCTFCRTGPCHIAAVAPNGIHPHAIAPRGYYMLFVLDCKGVPSEGKFIHLH